ncbi:Hypothetical protein NTJ_11175 [Nesidiocoris tenuis]|uniref:Uncharacterized protein n=1 Tax=Nesidiocoris tenuis TaxID=355587 RepID=A0ABN7B1S6_9HEMI|nr:Hypothetical protein NTJ_11175 [Nesidiocoris tenuis]
MKSTIAGLAIALSLLSNVSCGSTGPASASGSAALSREARDFTGYASAPSPASTYDTYDSAGSASYLSPDKWTQSGIILPNLGTPGCNTGGAGLLKPILAGLLGALLLKLPLLLAAKLLLLKLAVPFALLAAAAPVLLPVAYMFFNKRPGSSSSSQNDTAESRAFHDFLASTNCLEKIACSIGRSQARSDNVKTFSWMLKSVESLLGSSPSREDMRSLVGSYRTAYLTGATANSADGSDMPDTCSNYRCDFPEFFVRQGGTSYKLL